MKSRACLLLLLSAFLSLNPGAALSFETDQYNLSPVPLADIGEEVSEKTAERLLLAAARLNAKIESHQACLTGGGSGKNRCEKKETEIQKLAFLRSDEGLAREVYDVLGAGGVFETDLGKWIRTHNFAHTPSRFKTGYGHSIYVLLPTNYLTISPTVRLYGAEFGTDKIDHFFQQGYQYSSIARKQIKRGLTMEQAEKKAVQWGQKTEQTYFGSWVSGVYSNADLFANYAGMRFYQGLTEKITIDKRTFGPLFYLRDGYWNIAASGPNWKKNLLKPFITDHMNEALNPSGYSFLLFSSVKKMAVKYGCRDWLKEHPELRSADYKSKTKSLEKWNGEDYGFVRKKRVILLGELCFSEPSKTD